MSKYRTMVRSIAVYYKEENPIFGDSAITVSVDDEGGGMFLVLNQFGNDKTNEIRIDADEWPVLNRAVMQLRREIRKHDVSLIGEGNNAKPSKGE